MNPADELTRLLNALAGTPDPTPAAARARLHGLCNHHDGEAIAWRQSLMTGDPVTQLENLQLRKVIAQDDLSQRIKAVAAQVFPDMENPDIPSILNRVKM